MIKAYILTDSNEICVRASRLTIDGGMLYAWDGEETAARVRLEQLSSAELKVWRDHGQEERYCEVCGADIRERTAKAKYCRSCLKEVNKARSRASYRVRHGDGTADYAGLAAAEIAALKEKAAKEGPKRPAGPTGGRAVSGRRDGA